MFPQFPQLPGEIRLKIWGFALSTPRNITISSDRPAFKRGAAQATQTFQADVPAPATLHTCAESRHEALAVYKPYFKTYRTKNDYFLSTGRYLYTSFQQDTFQFEDTLLAYFAEPELQGMQNVVMDVKDCGYFGHFNMDIVKRMSNLKKLDLIGDKGVQYSWSTDPDSWISQLSDNFYVEKQLNPGWECPSVRIFRRENSMLVREIEGGAVIPGWTNSEK